MKHFFWIISLILFCHPWMASAVEIVGAPKVAMVGRDRAKVSWKTDTPSGSRVLYGESEAQLKSVKGEGVTDSHELTLDQLKPNQTYLVKVGSAKVTLATFQFNTSGTALESAEEGPKDRANAPPVKKPEATVTPASSIRIPPANQSWNRWSTLQDHYDRHGPDFGSKTPEDYANAAYVFLIQAIQQGLPAKYDPADDTLRIFEAKTRTFAAYTKSGRTRTFFKPQSPSYFQRQPGNSVNLRDLFGKKK